ncbi:anthranilate phosphoribosyltransferase [Phaffia rhodozyma]|uniref:Anthranilate phosphoribosyltransferase n=1 Tax=Phaffia rhodozyma TaxID=264483 RepID=A0A0F7SJ56_PHARH|nr:anthranilate phosphoribosyltransferase [Phaffia rhodozyma]
MSTDLLTQELFKPLLKKIVSEPSAFTAQDATLAFEHLASGPTGASEAQVGSFLTALTLSGVDQRPDIVAACAKVMRKYAVQVDIAGLHQEETVVDIVGTGGDGHDTFNVSTSAGIVAAGAGAVVCKHGNRASTSTSGSADLLLSLSCPLTFPPGTLSQILTPSSKFAFLFASLYHPSLGQLAPIRKTLPFRTIYNVLGPLVNPARPQGMVIGVHSYKLGMVFAQALKDLGMKRALVVCGKEGLDEISPAGETWVWSLENDLITEQTLHPTTDFGLPTHPLSTVRGGPSDQNAVVLLALLSDSPAPPSVFSPSTASDSSSPSYDAIRDFILINASATLVVAGKAQTFKQGVELARKSMNEGGALKALDEFRKRAGLAVENAGL